MENTLENRLKFYAQHLGQNIIIDSDCFRSENGNDIIHTKLVSVSLKGIECDGWIPVTEHTALELKPLSLITDEDYKKVFRSEIMNPEHPSDDIELDGRIGGIKLSDITTADFLRSKGYSLPWMGLSIEKLQEYGWIKLKTD